MDSLLHIMSVVVQRLRRPPWWLRYEVVSEERTVGYDETGLEACLKGQQVWSAAEGI